jgi:tetratricopeptide (TPR) repeat protein
MDKLIQIIRNLDNYKIRHIDVLNNKDSTSRATQLYQEIQKGKINTDDEAARFLFGKDAHKGLSSYRTFKTDFKKRILNTFLFIDPSYEGFDEYQQMVYETNREWMTIKALYANGMSHLATPLAEQLLKTVLKYEYAEIGVPLISHIKHGIAMTGDKKKYAEYQKLHNQYIELWFGEQKASEYCDILKMEYVKSIAYKPHMSVLASTYFEELKPFMEQHNSVAIHFYSRIVEIYKYSTINDYKNVLAAAERALTFFRSHFFVLNMGISIFTHQKMIALMMLKRYAEAENAIEETIPLRIQSSFNWFKAQESKVALLFKMHRYTEGYAIYKEMTALHEFNKVLTGMNKEMWLLFKAYFHLLHQLGVPMSFDKKEATFKISKFLNDVPTFSSDKKGMNLALLIVEICFILSVKQHDMLTDRIETIEKYFDRNTDKTDPTYRFHQFGTMLLVIPKSNFNRSIVETQTTDLLENLQSVPANILDDTYRGEVMDFEDLWEILLNLL